MALHPAAGPVAQKAEVLDLAATGGYHSLGGYDSKNSEKTLL
jgi:hypothetical protein